MPINNLFIEIPVNECDWAMACPTKPVCVVSQVDNETQTTVERRPFCEHHMAVRLQSASMSGDKFHYEVHPLTWLQRRTLV